MFDAKTEEFSKVRPLPCTCDHTLSREAPPRIGDAEFDGEIEAWTPVVCKHYNEFIGCDGWSEEDHTVMTR